MAWCNECAVHVHDGSVEVAVDDIVEDTPVLLGRYRYIHLLSILSYPSPMVDNLITIETCIRSRNSGGFDDTTVDILRCISLYILVLCVYIPVLS